MTKKLLSIMLITVLAITAVFAYPTWEWDPSVSVTCDFTTEHGNFYFKQVGVYSAMTSYGTTDFLSKARVGFTTDFKTDSLINGLRVDVMVGKYNEKFIGPWPASYTIASAGLSTDLHLVDGKLKANFAVLAEGQFYEGGITDFATPSFALRYVFANNTGIDSLMLSFGVEHEITTN